MNEKHFMEATEDAPLTDAERAEMDAKYAAHTASKLFPVGTRVSFREGTAPYAKNKGLVYTVTSSVNIDNTHTDGPRPYVVLVLTDDEALSPSRRRIRSGYTADLTECPT